MFDYLFFILALTLGVVAIYLLYIIVREKDSQKRNLSGWLMLGPLWPSMNEYLKKRGGLTRRETIGWVIVLIIMLVGLIIATIFPTKLGGN